MKNGSETSIDKDMLFERRYELLALVLTASASIIAFAAKIAQLYQSGELQTVFGSGFTLRPFSISAGIALGGFISVVNFRLMGQVAYKQIFHSAGVRKTMVWTFLRFIMMGLALAAGALNPHIDLFAVAGGLLAVQAAIMLDAGLGYRFSTPGPRSEE